jgi:hypothetical protein
VLTADADDYRAVTPGPALLVEARL